MAHRAQPRGPLSYKNVLLSAQRIFFHIIFKKRSWMRKVIVLYVVRGVSLQCTILRCLVFSLILFKWKPR
jgi:hypothetical protein